MLLLLLFAAWPSCCLLPHCSVCGPAAAAAMLRAAISAFQLPVCNFPSCSRSPPFEAPVSSFNCLQLLPHSHGCCRGPNHAAAAALRRRLRTLVPAVRVTRVLPTLRVVNMEGALMSYLHKVSEYNQRRQRQPSPAAAWRRGGGGGGGGGSRPAATCNRGPRAAIAALLAAPPAAPAIQGCFPLPAAAAGAVRAPVLLGEGVDTA